MGISYQMGSPANPREFSPQGLAGSFAGGGRRAAKAPAFLGGNVQPFQDAMREGVQGYGNMLGEDLRKQIGVQLGDLNSIGALRSGAVQTGVNDATAAYGRQIGNYASQATGQAVGMAQQENDNQIERGFRDRQYNDAKKASKRRGIGQLLGGAAGMLLGPAVGAVGGAIGGRVSSMLGGKK